LDSDSGRFWTKDGFEGWLLDPRTLHKYVYTHADPINGTDPGGNFEFTIGGLSLTSKISSEEDAQDAQRAKRNYNWARRGLCAGGAIGVVNMHHALPWFLGGRDQESNLIPIPSQEHAAFHQMLHWALRAAMLPGTAADATYEELFKEAGGKLERELVHKIVLAVSEEFDKKCYQYLGYKITPVVQKQIDNKEWDF
jgi:hypothetical protein